LTNKTEKFISKSIKKFKDKFQYTAVDYVSPKLKIKLICPKHGIFEITPANHLSSTAGGCVQCQRDNAKVGTDKFIERSTKIHNGKYDYSLVDYKRSDTKVKIICPIHGIFEQLPQSHLKGNGCHQCSGKQRKTTEQFIKEAKEVHGDLYDYSLVDYKTTTTYVKIVCKEHGIFEQYPTAHVNRGDGCPECGKHYKPKRYTQEDYIEKAREVHGDVYDLSSVVYIGCADKLYPTCREHGLFPQTGSRFLRGFGCPKCANRGFKYDEPCELYIHKVFTENIFIGLKFGVSYNHEARLKVLKQFSPNLEFETVFVKNFGTGREAFNIENAIKSKFSEVIPFISKSTMEDGYTETLPPYSLQKLLEFINQTS
jgi:hypothetical protein